MKRGGLRGGILKNKCEAGGALTGTGNKQQNIKTGFTYLEIISPNFIKECESYNKLIWEGGIEFKFRIEGFF
jgi:hypothetical protein